MNIKTKSLRAFIGAKNYNLSREFYKALDFHENVIDDKMSYFSVNENLGFYLQDYYKKDWINNSMLFLEVDNLIEYEQYLLAKNLDEKFKNVRFTKIRNETWGREIFMHDPSGVLWHFGEFNKLDFLKCDKRNLQYE